MALERVADGAEGQNGRRRPGVLTNRAGDTKPLIRYYSVLLRTTDLALEQLAGSPPEVLEVLQEYRDQYQAQLDRLSGVRES